jgi:hypothetical protein
MYDALFVPVPPPARSLKKPSSPPAEPTFPFPPILRISYDGCVEPVDKAGLAVLLLNPELTHTPRLRETPFTSRV